MKKEKPVKYVMTNNFMDHYSATNETLSYIGLALQIWKYLPIDMLIFDETNNMLTIHASGYNVNTSEYIDKCILTINKVNSNPIKKFWLKYEEHLTFWLGTFLFPEEY